MQEQENKKEQDLNSTLANTGWKRWLNYQSIVKQVPFFLFLAMLAVIYIYNGHLADKTIRKINQTAKEVKELIKAVEPLGLKELVESPIVLKDVAVTE